MGDAGSAEVNDPTTHGETSGKVTEHGTFISGHSASSGGDVMDLLAEHVPLALLADLVAPGGPVSSEILKEEGLPDDAWWETPSAASSPSDAAAAGAADSPAEREGHQSSAV